MKIALVGETYAEDSLPFNASRSVNLYPVMDSTGKEVSALYGTPGLTLFGNLGTGPWSEVFPSRSTGRAFGVSGSQFYEINADGTGTVRGTLLQSNNIVYMVENPTQLAVCDGTNLYIFTYATNVFQQIVGGLSYVTNGTFSGGSTGWTLGSNWSIVSSQYAYAAAASSTLSQTSPLTLVSGITYTLTYTISGVQFVTDGTFQSAIDWTAGSGWVVGTGTATATASSAAVSQTAANTLVSGHTYNVSFTITRTAGTLACSLGGGTAGTAESASGTYNQVITAGSTQVIAFTGSSFTGTLSNVSITPTMAGNVTSSVAGVSGVTQSAPGIYTDTIVAGAGSQIVKFTGVGFTGTISDITVNDPANGFIGNIGNIDYIDGFFVAPENGTKQFYKSALNDGTSWNALDFASKTSTSDPLSRVKQAVGQLWLLGTEAGEVWSDTGASSFPFQRISGAKLTIGCQAPATAIEMDNSIFWVGQSKEGDSIVYRAFGFTPMRISTTPIEFLLKQATDPKNIRAISYQREGHLFYMLTGGGLPTSLCYDVTTKMWHERAFQNSQGFFETHLANCCMSWNGLTIVGDKNSGNLYILDENAFSDNGSPQVAERIYTNIAQEDKRMRFNRLSIFCENGVGTQSGQGVAPVMELYASKDGARTWLGPDLMTMGAVGAYQTKAVSRRLGIAEVMTFKLRISDPVKRRLIGSYLS